MMPVLRVNDATFANLSTLKTWFGTTTPSDTIDRVVKEVMEQLGMERDDEPETVLAASDGAMEFESAPGLSFTKPKTASVNGKDIPAPRWASILLAVIAAVKAKGPEGERLVKELAVPSKVGSYWEEGFRFHPNLGISIQGQSAAEAWKEADRLAREWAIPVEVEFRWRQNPKAQYPGRTGILRSGNLVKSSRAAR